MHQRRDSFRVVLILQSFEIKRISHNGRYLDIYIVMIIFSIGPVNHPALAGLFGLLSLPPLPNARFAISPVGVPTEGVLTWGVETGRISVLSSLFFFGFGSGAKVHRSAYITPSLPPPPSTKDGKEYLYYSPAHRTSAAA